MRKIGTLNAQLAYVLAGMEHGDMLAVCDSGFPIPHGSEIVDLALTRNIPRSIEALKVILEELHLERAIVTNEMEERSKWIFDEITALLPDHVEITKISHEQFKVIARTERNIVFVRTGEATPFANFILVSGVTF